jgi:hypothetical protein
MTFDEELTALVEGARAEGKPPEEIALMVAELFRQHGKEPPEPIIGTVEALEASDEFKDVEKE